MDDHNRSKDFWNKAIIFLADNKTFSLDMISGLEAFAIGKAIEAKRYEVENTVNPKYEIDEYDLPLIEEVYDEIKFIMATQGYKMENSKTTLNEANTLHTTRKTELLFVALFTKMLKVGGRCACIVPDGVLFGSSKAHQAIRRELVENQQL